MTKWIRRAGLAGLAGLGWMQAAWAEKPDYRTEGQCDGLPAITSLQVAPEFCLALAASNRGRARGVLALNANQVLVTDMGRWETANGRLLELTRTPGKPFEVKVLLTGLNKPHGIRRDAQGRILLAEAHRISRLELPAAKLQPIITGLPTQGRHPLKAFVVDDKGALWVNYGAPTDHCEAFDGVEAGTDKGCGQTGGAAPMAAIWKFTQKGETWTGKPYAWGLRNSVGLAFHPESGQLWQAENSRDTLPGEKYSKASPPDELNVVLEGKNYGWPHCTGTDVLDTSFGAASCKDFTAPTRLLPAHAAPLGMLFYKNAGPGKSDKWQGSLVMAWHGYQPTGHRLMAWRFDAKHQPIGTPLPLIAGWDAKKDKHPMGAPVEVAQDDQSRIWVTEDRNGTLLLLAPR